MLVVSGVLLYDRRAKPTCIGDCSSEFWTSRDVHAYQKTVVRLVNYINSYDATRTCEHDGVVNLEELGEGGGDDLRRGRHDGCCGRRRKGRGGGPEETFGIYTRVRLYAERNLCDCNDLLPGRISRSVTSRDREHSVLSLFGSIDGRL